MGRGLREPRIPSSLLYTIRVHGRFGYSGKYFRGNQLLDGSISLSPLYKNLQSDLHVSTCASFHQSFLWLRPLPA